jgi:hypothetical protein
MRCLVANTGVQSVVIVIVKIIGDAGLRVGQVGKNGPLAEFEHFGFEAGPEAFGLGVVVALALPGTTAAALRTHGPVPVQERAVGVAAVLATLPGTTPVGVDDERWGGRLGEKGPLQGRGD